VHLWIDLEPDAGRAVEASQDRVSAEPAHASMTMGAGPVVTRRLRLRRRGRWITAAFPARS